MAATRSANAELSERDRRCGCASVGRYVSTINALPREFPLLLPISVAIFQKGDLGIGIIVGFPYPVLKEGILLILIFLFNSLLTEPSSDKFTCLNVNEK